MRMGNFYIRREKKGRYYLIDNGNKVKYSRDRSEFFTNYTAKSEAVFGIYFLINNGEIVYIGQTHNVLQRVYTHKHKSFTSFRFIECPAKSCNFYEMRWIRKFNPKYNINGGRKKKYDFDKLLKNGKTLKLPFSQAARVTAHSWARRSGKKVLTLREADEILIWLKN